MAEQEKPYAEKEKVRQMFNDIAPKYDLLNSILSAGIHKRWRRKVRKLIKPLHPERVLDVATGTGDLAIMAAQLGAAMVKAVDISTAMMERGKLKAQNKGVSSQIEFINADAASLPFSEGTFDLALVGFGVRNFESPKNGLLEIRRVLKPEATFIILEFSEPRQSFFRKIYTFYFRHILPFIGKVISGNPKAYTYLPDSVGRFPAREEFTRLLSECGFRNSSYRELSRGIACLYVCDK